MAAQVTDQDPFEPEENPLPSPEKARSRWHILWHLLLFLVTVVTTMAAGAFQAGVNLFSYPWRIYQGLPFSVSILLILTAHEMGHYVMSRRHNLDVSLPYFLPGLPFPPPLPGTFGALIRIRSPIMDKRALIDVGCSGPLLGILASLPVLVVGLSFSRVLPGPTVLEPYSLQLGEPLLFRLVSWLVLGPLAPEYQVVLHPVAFAGWLGLLITALNLLPVGQLDGGHVIYALFPGWHRRISIACLIMLGLFGILTWKGWLVWAVVLIGLGFRHPPPYCHWIPLDRRRTLLGMVTILVFFLTFTPAPFKLE